MNNLITILEKNNSSASDDEDFFTFNYNVVRFKGRELGSKVNKVLNIDSDIILTTILIIIKR